MITLELTEKELRAMLILAERGIRDGSNELSMKNDELELECRSIREKIAAINRKTNS